MKKALTITIAGTLFNIEEDAYHELDRYLHSVKQYFGSFQDSQEIINDIEARIAEQLLERSNKDAVVTIDDVQKIISVMGRVEDFDGSEKRTSASNGPQYQGPRRLFRNPDDVWIMGVASGIAAYFGIDSLLIRLAFVILTFITGIFPGIVIYFILSLIIPSADTAAQKMQMRGGPANLQSFKESMNEYSENIKRNAHNWKEQWKNYPHHGDDESFHNSESQTVENRGSRGLVGLIRSLVRLVFKLVGLAIKLAATLAIIFVVLVFIAMAFRLHPFNTVPFLAVMGWPMYYLVLGLGFLVAILPLSLLSMIGNVVMLRGKSHEWHGAIGIIGTWFAAALILGFIVVSYGPNIKDRIEELPQYQMTSEVRDLKNFTNISVEGVGELNVVNGPEYSVRVEGMQENLDKTDLEVTNGTLTVSKAHQNGFCLFCIGPERTKVYVTMPATDSITMKDVSMLSGTISSTTAQTSVFTLTLSNAAHGTLTLKTPNSHISVSDVAHLVLNGSGKLSTVIARDASRFDGSKFAVENASVETHDMSRVHVNASSTLDAVGQDVSRIYYSGSPKMTQKTSNMARIEHE